MALNIAFAPGNDTLVTITRGPGVSDVTWSSVSGLLTPFLESEKPGLLVIQLNGFLSRLASFASVAQRNKTSLVVTGGLKRLLEKVAADSRIRRDIAANRLPLLAADVVRDELSQTRFCRRLRPFQERDVAKLVTLPHGANFSVPGAGKTTVSYAVYEILRHRGVVDRLVVVAPLSAFGAWKEEAQTCFSDSPSVAVYTDGPLPNAEVVLINYHKLANRYDKLVEFIASRPTHVILDEAHRVKRGRAGTHGSAALDLALYASRRDVLTGTPAPQALTDLEPLVDFLWPGQVRQVLPDGLRQADPPDTLVDTVKQHLAPLYVRTTKKELCLPPTRFQVEKVPMGHLQQALYDGIRGVFREELNIARSTKHELRRLGRVSMYLLEAATNPLLLLRGSSEDDPFEFQHPPLPLDMRTELGQLLERYVQYETPAKIERCVSLAREVSRDGKILIWTTFRRNIALLERMLADLNPAVIHGGVPSVDTAPPAAQRVREEEIRRFHEEDNCRVMIANFAACSEGVSLHHACHHAVFLDRTFNAGQFLQAQDRIHRLGLDPLQLTTFTLLISPGTVDEIVDTRLGDKIGRMSRVLDDPYLIRLALPSEEEPSGDLDFDDAVQLVEHIDAIP